MFNYFLLWLKSGSNIKRLTRAKDDSCNEEHVKWYPSWVFECHFTLTIEAPCIIDRTHLSTTLVQCAHSTSQAIEQFIPIIKLLGHVDQLCGEYPCLFCALPAYFTFQLCYTCFLHKYTIKNTPQTRPFFHTKYSFHTFTRSMLRWVQWTKSQKYNKNISVYISSCSRTRLKCVSMYAHDPFYSVFNVCVLWWWW